MRVLVVDDSADVRFMLRLLLEEEGMTVDEATSGPAAIERLLDGEVPAPDVVVLDQRMPGITGLEVLRELAGRQTGVRMILFSAYLHPTLQAEAEALGATTIVKTELAALVDAVQGLSPVAV